MNAIEKTENMQVCENHIANRSKYISKEQFYKFCHISKRTALYLLESGLVLSECSDKKSWKYKISMKDVIAYLADREIQPERYQVPDGWYKYEIKGEVTICPAGMYQNVENYFEKILEMYPDVLSVGEVSEITGYVRQTVNRWCATKKLYRLHIHGAYIIPKTSLIEFMAGMKFRKIQMKSEKHLAYIEDLRQANLKNRI